MHLGDFGVVHFMVLDEDHKKKILLDFFFKRVFEKLGLTPMDAYAYILGNAFEHIVQVPAFRNLTPEELEDIKRIMVGAAHYRKTKENYIKEIRSMYPEYDNDLTDESLIELFEYINHFKLIK